MRIFLVLICSLALASLAPGAQEQKKKEKKGAQAAQVAQPAGKKGGAKPVEAGKPAKTGNAATAGMPGGKGKHEKTGQGAGAATAEGKPAEYGKPKGQGQAASANKAEYGKPRNQGQPQHANVNKPPESGKTKGQAQVKNANKPAETTAAATRTGKGAAKGKPFKPQKFNLANKTKPNKATAPAVSFQQGKKIQGSKNWQGSNYTVFRNYTPVWHNRDWWRHHHSRLVFVFGGWYYWDAGFWFPAWGYDPGAYYAYDGPIYAYNNLPPDQVIANVQTALQEQGYYRGEVDGLLGPLTRDAIVGYQRDHGLYQTSAIDRPTLESLGMA